MRRDFFFCTVALCCNGQSNASRYSQRNLFSLLSQQSTLPCHFSFTSLSKPSGILMQIPEREKPAALLQLTVRCHQYCSDWVPQPHVQPVGSGAAKPREACQRLGIEGKNGEIPAEIPQWRVARGVTRCWRWFCGKRRILGGASWCHTKKKYTLLTQKEIELKREKAT